MSAPASIRRLVPGDAVSPSHSTGLPADVLIQSARRLRIQALLYAFAFFVSALLPGVVFPETRAFLLSTPLHWAPPVISIAAALIVVLATLSSRIPVSRVLGLGLVFEVVGSFGIAAAQYLDGSRYVVEPPWAGLSWVAVWVVGFTVVAPSQPRRALAAALASVSAVPITVGLVMATGLSPVRLGLLPFFFLLVLPYLLVVLIAYVSARVVYGLGTAITRAREMGSYQLIERLGHGGMGEVWLAKHRLLARPAAVKLMRPEVMAAGNLDRRTELHQRFEREAQATASLRSPHTVELYDFGITDDGTFYYVMELLDGFDLETLVRRFGPMPPERAIYLLTQLCHSLAEAHGAGMVHRDVKPANVYVCRRGRDVDFVKVLDFGLVKSHRRDDMTEMDLSRDQAVRGTPSFMAPEQALGAPMDGRADIYATGCLAYWLLTGERVFTGGSAIEVLMQHAQVRPVPPSQRTTFAIPASLEALIMDCLEKNPADRPPTADVVATRLAEVTTASAWHPKRIRDWWDANGVKVESDAQ